MASKRNCADMPVKKLKGRKCRQVIAQGLQAAACGRRFLPRKAASCELVWTRLSLEKVEDHAAGSSRRWVCGPKWARDRPDINKALPSSRATGLISTRTFLPPEWLACGILSPSPSPHPRRHVTCAASCRELILFFL